jgi:hypothetical protein
MTRIARLRLMILHFSQIGLTDGLTFILALLISFQKIANASARFLKAFFAARQKDFIIYLSTRFDL